MDTLQSRPGQICSISSEGVKKVLQTRQLDRPCLCQEIQSRRSFEWSCFFFSLSPIWVRCVLRPKPIKSRSDANMEGSRTNRETEVSSQLTNKTNPKTDFFKLATPGLFFFIFVFSRLQLTDNYI